MTKAAKNGHLNVVDLLIANGADINQINLRGETALIRAQKQKHTKVEKILTKQCSLESNKNEINATNYNNKPSIKVTVLLKQKNSNLVKCLILSIIKLFIIYAIFLILLINW
ncbi:ankyrin repeat domain-containing protein [Spiroplasma endosymbiont of Cleonymus obscurus]|uniref:ankyrin repeat domain-containing protein n=1 Tax=Spiroplasma endosymbiont of Cleonymus obscurus TaxID=3066324 RepID=UPI0037DCBD02